MAEGLPLLAANVVEFDVMIHEDNEDWEVELPPDFALIGVLSMEPKLLDNVLNGPNAKAWKTALEYKISQLEKLGTWVIEDLPIGHTTIPCSAVLKETCGSDSEIVSYWVYIVTGGHKQVEGVNCSEMFSPTMKMPTVQAVLANAVTQDWEIEHVDVKSVYLNVMLKKMIYIKPP